MKDCYREHSARTGVPWRGRRYTPGDFSSGDAVNQAITAAAQCLYGIAHAVVVSLACSPALGFVHSGHELSFVLDVADLYKTDIGIPVAFDVAAEDDQDVGTRTRRALRDQINKASLLDRCVDDFKGLFLPPAAHNAPDTDRVVLHTDGGHHVPAGRVQPLAQSVHRFPSTVPTTSPGSVVRAAPTPCRQPTHSASEARCRQGGQTGRPQAGPVGCPSQTR